MAGLGRMEADVAGKVMNGPRTDEPLSDSLEHRDVELTARLDQAIEHALNQYGVRGHGRSFHRRCPQRCLRKLRPPEAPWRSR